MNIFKVLAQGDGTINEPNVSAFLGYLLNPNEDHGLDSSFLEKFLQQHYLFCNELEKLSNNKIKKKDKNENSIIDTLDEDYRFSSKYEVKVFFEQAFKGTKQNNNLPVSVPPIEKNSELKKEVVDIILLVYEIAPDGKTETKFENYLSNDRLLKHIFLIEVKVKNDSCSTKKDIEELAQLEAQIIKSKEKIITILGQKDSAKYTEQTVDKLLSAIFVSPGTDCSKATDAFIRSFNHAKIKSIPKSHIFWNKPNNATHIRSIYNFNDNYLAITGNNEVIESETKDDSTIPWNSIEEILDAMIYSDGKSKQVPIPQYTIDTIKSFSDFIYSDFTYKNKKPKQYNQKPYTTISDLLAFLKLSDSLSNIINEGFALIQNKLISKIDKVEDFGTKHLVSFKISNKKFASITNQSKKEVRLKFLKSNFKFGSSEENKEKFTFAVEKFEYPTGMDDESYYLILNDVASPQILASIINDYYNLYLNNKKEKEDAL